MTRDTRSTRQARGFWPMRDLPVVFWLVATVAVALVHPFVPAPRWLMIHLLLLGAVTHAIFVWSRHFAGAVLRSPAGVGDRRTQSVRLMLLNAGVVGVAGGVLSDAWPVTVGGAVLVGSAVLWHGATLLAQLRRALPSRFGVTVRYYLVAAALLPVGATLGTILARGVADPLETEMKVAHAATNLLGWMGLTIVGTLVTLWPTMLRTRVAEGTERAARHALPVLAGSVGVVVTAALLGSRPAVVLGLAGYLAGIGLVAGPFARTCAVKRPSSYPTWSLLAGLLWWVGALAALAVGVAAAPSWEVVDDRFSGLTPFLAAGFGAQVLLGALSYLVPMALGGGPGPVRAANTVLDRGGALRITLVNGGLLVAVLPVPGVVRVIATLLVLGALAAFVPLLLLALRASRKAKAAPPSAPEARADRRRAAPDGERPPGQVRGLVAAGIAAVVLAVAIGVAVDPGALSGTRSAAAAAGAAANGQTRTVRVQAHDMRFTPSRIDVPVGTRLVIKLTNTDDQDVHDLVLDSGADSGRLSPGDSATLDVGVVGRDIEGWCSVVGHRQMGMVLTIGATGEHGMPGGSDAMAASSPASSPGETAHLDPMAEPRGKFTPHDAELPSLADTRVQHVTLRVGEVEREVAPGVRQRLWTYNGSAPGPVLHGRVGDTFVVTLVNDGTMGHSIDFHAGSLAPDGPMRTIAPGRSLVYRFTATRAGIWMYHCSTMPMSAHIANGMFGTVVIEPPDLPEVDRSYLLVQSEMYFGKQGGPVDVAKAQAERPDAVVFNGYADQYDAHPLPARSGERVRVWVLDAGPNRSTSFHVVGGQFDTVYAEGSYLLRDGSGGAQALALAPSQGGFVELTFPEPGRYPFVSHVMVDAERGAHGLFAVTR